MPPTLFSQYLPGFTTDSPTCEEAAKCSTASKEESTYRAASWIRPSMKVAPAGIPSRKPVLRSSRTVTSWPASSRWAATTLPTYPAPPVTRYLCIAVLLTRLLPLAGEHAPVHARTKRLAYPIRRLGGNPGPVSALPRLSRRPRLPRRSRLPYRDRAVQQAGTGGQRGRLQP